MISGRPIREARVLLGWIGDELRKRTGIDNVVLTGAQAVDGTTSITLHQDGLIQQAFESGGVRFGRNGSVLVDARNR